MKQRSPENVGKTICYVINRRREEYTKHHPSFKADYDENRRHLIRMANLCLGNPIEDIEDVQCPVYRQIVKAVLKSRDRPISICGKNSIFLPDYFASFDSIEDEELWKKIYKLKDGGLLDLQNEGTALTKIAFQSEIFNKPSDSQFILNIELRYILTEELSPFERETNIFQLISMEKQRA